MAPKDSIKLRTEKPQKLPVLPQNIPDVLKSKPQWVMWNWVWNGKKWDKPLFRTSGYQASSTNPEHWSSYADAIAALPRFDGIGFAMSGAGLVGIDIDNCRNPATGDLTPFATKLIAELDTYAEVSPSGEGVKLWLQGEKPAGEWMTKNDDLGLEVYQDARYFTVTGNVVGDAKPIAQAGKQLQYLLVNYMRRSADKRKDRPKDKDLAREIARAKDAIKLIDADCDYKMWIDIGMSLNWLSDSLFDVWNEWSSQGGKYPGEEKCRMHWQSFSGEQSRITIGTLFHHAVAAGWVRDGARPTLSNCTTAENDKGKPVLVAKEQPEILADLARLGLDLIECRGGLYYIEGELVRPVRNETQLFAIIQSVAKVDWPRVGITKGEFFEAVKMTVAQVHDIELTPHFPPVPGIRYLHPAPTGRSAKAFDEYLDLFTPTSEADRELLRAAIATVCWGGAPGKRPAFAIVVDDADATGQVGAGKTTAVDLIAGVPNRGRPGTRNLRNKGSIDRLVSHAMDVRPESRRIILIDNLKEVLQGQDIESLITAAEVDGHKLYDGLAVCPNLFTWFITGNYLRTSEDIASRLITIHLRRPKNNPEWERKRQAVNYDSVLEGVAAFFDRPTKPLQSYNRWQLWLHEVLSRCDDPDALRLIIEQRAGGLSGIDEEAAEVREGILQLLTQTAPGNSRQYDPVTDHVFIPARRLMPYVEPIDPRKPWTPASLTQHLGRLLTSAHLLELSRSRSNSYRGFVWRGIAATAPHPDYDRLRAADGMAA